MALDIIVYVFLIIAIVGPIVQLLLSKAPRTKERVVELFLVWFLFLMVGVSSIWAFMGHVFDANAVAAVIGWPPGSPFQYEVGIANLAFGILGLLCLKIRENFWTATIIGFSVFYLGAAYGHIVNFLETGNTAPGNIGFALYMDILIPIILICLLIAYKSTLKSIKE
jgi:hypothetical protein